MIGVKSDNSDHFSVIQISNILVSSVETIKKIKNSQWKRKLCISSTAKNLFRVPTLHLRVCLRRMWKTKLLLIIQGSHCLMHIFSVFRFTFFRFQTFCLFLEKIPSIFNLTNRYEFRVNLFIFARGFPG